MYQLLIPSASFLYLELFLALLLPSFVAKTLVFSEAQFSIPCFSVGRVLVVFMLQSSTIFSYFPFLFVAHIQNTPTLFLTKAVP